MVTTRDAEPWHFWLGESILLVFSAKLYDGRLRLRLRIRGSIPAPAPAPAPSKTFRRLRLRLRLRAKCTGSGGSGSGSGSDAQVLIWALTSNTIFKNVKYQNMTSYSLDLEFECYFEWVPLKFVTHCHPRSVSDTGEVTNSLELRCLSGLLLSC